MKTSLLLLLGTSLTNAYVFPSLAYDQTQVTCDNVQTLLALSSADLSRFKLAVDVLIPSRIGRLTVVNRAVDRVCGSKTMLVQKSGSRSMATEEGDLDDVCSAAKDAISALADQFQDQEYKLDRLDDMLWSVTETCNQISDRLFDYTTSFLQVSKKSSHLKSGKKAALFSEDLGDLCQDVTNTVDNLSGYLEALQSQVQSLYVEETLPARIKSLTSSGANCLQTSVKSSIQASLPDIKSSLQSDLQKSILASVNSTVQSAIPTIQSAIQSSITMPLPKIVRLADPNNWSYQVPTKETTLGPYTYKVSLTKDTLIEFNANGHQNSAGSRTVLRWYVDESWVGTGSNVYPASYLTHGEWLTQGINQWIPITYSMSAIVPKGDHTLSLRTYTENGSGQAYINGVEVTLKIYQ